MSLTWRNFPVEGISALFIEAPGGGDMADINSLRNRPAKDPGSWLGNVKYHSSLDNLEVVSNTVVTIAHLSQAAAGSGTFVNANGVTKYNASSKTWLLVNHALSYRPLVLVAAGSNVLTPGMPVQSFSDGRGRFCSAIVDEANISLYEWTSVTTNSLPSININYTVLIFRQPRDPSGKKIFDFSGPVSLGFDRFNSGRKYAQIVAGGSPLGVTFGKTLDLANGAPRFVNPDGSIMETIPAGRGMNINPPGGSTYGASMAYNGTFTGSPAVEVQTP